MFPALFAEGMPPRALRVREGAQVCLRRKLFLKIDSSLRDRVAGYDGLARYVCAGQTIRRILHRDKLCHRKLPRRGYANVQREARRSARRHRALRNSVRCRSGIPCCDATHLNARLTPGASGLKTRSSGNSKIIVAAKFKEAGAP